MHYKIVSAVTAAAMLLNTFTIAGYAEEALPINYAETQKLYYDVTEFGAYGSDTKDDTQAIQSALDKVIGSEQQVTVYIPSGNYYIDSTLRLHSNTYLSLSKNARIIRTDETKYMLSTYQDVGGSDTGYNRSHDITIDGGVWDGNVADTTKSKGLVNIRNSKDINIINTEFTSCCGTHVVIFNGVSDLLVENTVFSDFVEFTGTEEEYRDQTKANLNYRVCEALHIDFIPRDEATGTPGVPCRNVTVTGCTFNNCVSGIGTHHLYDYMQADNIQIYNNDFNDIWFHCVNAYGFSNFLMYDNTAFNVGGLIYANDTSGSVYGNKLIARSYLMGSVYDHYSGNDYLHAARFSQGSSIRFNSNTIYDSSGASLCITNNSYVNAYDNQIYNSQKSGILIQNCSSSRIYGNIVDGAKESGIIARSNTFIDSISKNTVKNTDAHGIAVSGSYIDSAAGNIISNTEKHGVYITSKSQAAFSGTNISNCEGSGFYASDSSTLKSNGNNIQNSGKHAFMITNKSTAQIENGTLGGIKSKDLYITEKSKGIVFKNIVTDKLSVKIADGCSAEVKNYTQPLTSDLFEVKAGVYTGKAVKPEIVSKLKKNTDYTVSYENNINVGTGTVTIKGKGSYTGTLKYNFKINPKKQTITSLTNVSGGAKLKWKKHGQSSGYQIAYSTSKSFTNQTKKTVNGKDKHSAKITSLKKGKTYYFRVRTFMKVNGNTYYGKWSAKKKIKIN